MKLKILDNIWGEKVEIGHEGSPFTKDVIVIILIFLIVIVETPIILLLLKKIASSDLNFLFFSSGLIILLLTVFILVFLSSPPKLLNLKASKAKGELELIWRKNLIFKTQQIIASNLINKMLINVIETTPQSIVRMEIETFDGKKINTHFILGSYESNEKINEILLNLAIIIGFKSYTTERILSSYTVLFTKSKEGKFYIDDFKKELKFDDVEDRENLSSIKIPDLTIRELTEAKISLYKRPSLYDILRLIIVFLIFPGLFIFAFINKNPGSYIPVVLVLLIYIFIVYLIRRLISPMEIIIDRIRGIVRVKKLFLSLSFPISQIQQIELSEQLSRRTGTLLFHVDARLKNGRKHQLFYTEFIDKDDRRYEVFNNIMLLLKIIQARLDVEIKNNIKHL